MEKLRMRSRVLAVLVALALVLAMQVVPAGAAETAAVAKGATSPGLAAGPSAERLAMTETIRGLDLPRPDRAEIAALVDDNIPGDSLEAMSELPYPLVLENLDVLADPWDVYRVTAYPGDQISFFADPDPLGEGSTLQVGLALWDATATGVEWPAVTSLVDDVGSAPGEPAWICYTVPAAATSTTYYIGVHALAGDNDVDYQWGVTSRSDGNIPGVTLPESGFEDLVRSDGDQDDVFAVHLGEGETLTVDVTVVDGDPIWLYLFEPGSDDTWTAGDGVDHDGPASTLQVTYTPLLGEAGVYYIDVWAGSADAAYTLEWSVTGANLPGNPMPTSGSTVSMLPGSNVYYVDLRVGETLQVSLTDPPGNCLLFLLPPESVSVTDPAAVSDVVSVGTKHVAYTVPAGKGGRYYVDVEGAVPANSTVTWSTKTNPARLAGSGRYDTAVLVSQRDFADGADTVIIASGEGFADALSAAGLAGAYDAPILLVSKSALPPVVRTEIIRLGATRAFVVGGTAVVTDGVKSAIDAIPGMGTPRRIAGPNRFDTSALVADEVFTKCGLIVDWRGMAAMARGDAFADALALAPLAWAAKMPILLTAPTYLPLPIDLRLPDAGPTELPIYGVIFAGGTSAVSNAVFNYVEAIPGVDCERLAGLSRYETAAKIAAFSADTGLLSYEAVGVATGANFPDALGGGAGIAKSGGVLLMTEPARFTGDTASALATHKAETHELQVYGGVGAVNTTVFNQIKGLY